MLLKTNIIILALLISFITEAQVTISGTVMGNNTKQPLQNAVIEIRNIDSPNILQRVNTDSSGWFKTNSNTANIIVEISYVGYRTKLIKKPKLAGNEILLGEIVLSKTDVLLEEVVVRAAKSTTEFKLDKRVFNVGQDISSTGMSALEVLNNVPSVMVNIEGQVSLRGNSGVQILINGKPSVLADQSSNALGTITADMIESIEVITNPSAKYEAEGTAGIINIILKKEDSKDFNGSI
ncbi:MAG: TonB-dependent receptor plug domain-containing protein, partial [Niabella sp.]